MARKASSNLVSGNATATTGFGASFRISGNHPVPPKPAWRGSANFSSEGKPQVVSETKDNMVALPGQLFYSTQIPVCIWFRTKYTNHTRSRGRLALN